MSNDALKRARDKYLAQHKPAQREVLAKAWRAMFPEASKLLAKLPPIPVTSETFERQYMGTFATPEPEPPSPTGRVRSRGFGAMLEDLVLGWRWTLVDKPIGSSATLTDPNASSTDLTPDVAGGYLVRLETFRDAARTIADDGDEQLERDMRTHDDMVDAATIAFRATKPPPTPPEAFAARMKKLRTREE